MPHIFYHNLRCLALSNFASIIQMSGFNNFLTSLCLCRNSGSILPRELYGIRKILAQIFSPQLTSLKNHLAYLGDFVRGNESIKNFSYFSLVQEECIGLNYFVFMSWRRKKILVPNGNDRFVYLNSLLNNRNFSSLLEKLIRTLAVPSANADSSPIFTVMKQSTRYK